MAPQQPHQSQYEYNVRRNRSPQSISDKKSFLGNKIVSFSLDAESISVCLNGSGDKIEDLVDG